MSLGHQIPSSRWQAFFFRSNKSKSLFFLHYLESTSISTRGLDNKKVDRANRR
jgi:hypothetical protein